MTVACLKKLVAEGHIDRREETVAFITGAGLKTVEAVVDNIVEPLRIDASAASFDRALAERQGTAVAAPAGGA